MARKTSVSLSDEDDALLHARIAEGDTLKAVVRRGLGVERVDVALARRAAAEALEALRPDLEEWIETAVKRAFTKMQGGSW